MIFDGLFALDGVYMTIGVSAADCGPAMAASALSKKLFILASSVVLPD